MYAAVFVLRGESSVPPSPFLFFLRHSVPLNDVPLICIRTCTICPPVHTRFSAKRARRCRPAG